MTESVDTTCMLDTMTESLSTRSPTGTAAPTNYGKGDIEVVLVKKLWKRCPKCNYCVNPYLTIIGSRTVTLEPANNAFLELRPNMSICVEKVETVL